MAKEVKLGDFCSVTMGLSPAGDTYTTDGEGMPLLNGPTEFGAVHPSCSLFTSDSKRECEAGDLIFCVRGNTTGKMNWADRPYSLGRGVAGLHAGSREELSWARYSIEARLNELLATTGGSTMPNLRKGDLEQFPIYLPEGWRVWARRVQDFDDLIENNRRRIEILEEMARLLYREWFVHFRFPGHEDVEMVDSELGPIPEGWEVDGLTALCSLVMGQSPKSEFYNEVGEGLPFHQGVTDFGLRYPTHRKWTTVDKRLAEEGDILFSVRAPVGRINVAPDRMVVGRGLSAIRANDGRQEFMLLQLKDQFAIEDSIGGGTIFNAVTKADMERINLLSPPGPLVDEFEKSVVPMALLGQNLTEQNRVLREARDLLLPRLVSGELDVSELDLEGVMA